MLKQKSKFLTFLFSLVPGAGHMYMGFMHTGLSIMGAFCLVIVATYLTGLGQLLFILPLLWFYSFFDSMNKSGASPDEFALLRDRWLFVNTTDGASHALRQYGGTIGIILIFFGTYLFINNFMHDLRNYLPYIVTKIMQLIPRLAIAAIIIAIGIKLILGKRKEMNADD